MVKTHSRKKATSAGKRLIEQIDVLLHGLCQPLTVLQCRLALGEWNGEPVEMRDAIEAALRECSRLNAAVGAMREMLQQALKTEEVHTRERER